MPVKAGSHATQCEVRLGRSTRRAGVVCDGRLELARFVVEGCATPIDLAGSWGAVGSALYLGCWPEGV